MDFTTTLTDFSGTVIDSLGMAIVRVTCTVTITDDRNNTEQYEASFHRSPISGILHNIDIKTRVRTTEHTLTSAKVEELVEAKLDLL